MYIHFLLAMTQLDNVPCMKQTMNTRQRSPQILVQDFFISNNRIVTPEDLCRTHKRYIESGERNVKRQISHMFPHHMTYA